MAFQFEHEARAQDKKFKSNIRTFSGESRKDLKNNDQRKSIERLKSDERKQSIDKYFRTSNYTTKNIVLNEFGDK